MATHFCRGDELDRFNQAHALASFLHRFTGDHAPEWAKKPMPDGKPYPLQFGSDEEWLSHTFFAVDTHGRLDVSVTQCYSRPTWPRNPELRMVNPGIAGEVYEYARASAVLGSAGDAQARPLRRLRP